jgi:hypothetical protein
MSHLLCFQRCLVDVHQRIGYKFQLLLFCMVVIGNYAHVANSGEIYRQMYFEGLRHSVGRLSETLHFADRDA